MFPPRPNFTPDPQTGHRPDATTPNTSLQKGQSSERKELLGTRVRRRPLGVGGEICFPHTLPAWEGLFRPSSPHLPLLSSRSAPLQRFLLPDLPSLLPQEDSQFLVSFQRVLLPNNRELTSRTNLLSLPCQSLTSPALGSSFSPGVLPFNFSCPISGCASPGMVPPVLSPAESPPRALLCPPWLSPPASPLVSGALLSPSLSRSLAL